MLLTRFIILIDGCRHQLSIFLSDVPPLINSVSCVVRITETSKINGNIIFASHFVMILLKNRALKKNSWHIL